MIGIFTLFLVIQGLVFFRIRRWAFILFFLNLILMAIAFYLRATTQIDIRL